MRRRRSGFRIEMSPLKIIATIFLIIPIYLVSWISIYFCFMGFDLHHILEYWKLSWTTGAGERVEFIQFFALGSALVVWLGVAFFVSRRAMNIRPASS